MIMRCIFPTYQNIYKSVSVCTYACLYYGGGRVGQRRIRIVDFGSPIKRHSVQNFTLHGWYLEEDVI